MCVVVCCVCSQTDPRTVAERERAAVATSDAVALFQLGTALHASKQANQWLTFADHMIVGAEHLFGTGVTRDFKEAARLFELAAALGHAHAQVNLGISSLPVFESPSPAPSP